MSKAIQTEVISAQDAERIERIAAYHKSANRAFEHQMAFIYLTGAELLSAKEELAHGQFMKWCESNLASLGISYPTANRYMHVAEALQTKLLSAKKTDLPRLALTNGDDIPESALTIISDAVREVVDGKSLTDLYRDLGKVKKPTHQSERDNSRKQTTAEDQKEINLAFTHRLANDARAWRTTASIQKDCEASDLSMLLDELVATSTHIRQLMKSRRSNNKKVGAVAPRRPHRKGKGK